MLHSFCYTVSFLLKCLKLDEFCLLVCLRFYVPVNNTAALQRHRDLRRKTTESCLMLTNAHPPTLHLWGIAGIITSQSPVITEEVFSVKLEEMGRQDKVKTLLKLHRQFAHPRPRKLKSLLQDADIWRDDYQDLLEEIDRKCELCKRYSKTPARPVVGMPMATQFNEKVAMDLKQWKG